MISGQCQTCKHYRGNLTCKAFPDQIPSQILTGVFDHEKPHPNDNGVRYEEDKNSPLGDLFDGNDSD